MTHTKDEALKLALLALEKHGEAPKDWACKECVPFSDILKDGFQCKYHEAITACQQALTAQPAPVQEPVAFPDLSLTPYQRSDGAPLWDTYHLHAYALRYAATLTTPPAAQRQRMSLTERELELIDGMIAVQLDHAARCDSIANRTMAEKQKGWDMERVALLQKLKENT